jgi:hypothetical protein
MYSTAKCPFQQAIPQQMTLRVPRDSYDFKQPILRVPRAPTFMKQMRMCAFHACSHFNETNDDTRASCSSVEPGVGA